MVRNVNYDDGTSSKIEVAFDLLVLRGVALTDMSTGIEKLDIDDLEEFAEHCELLCEDISRRRESPTEVIYDDTVSLKTIGARRRVDEDGESDEVDEDEELLVIQEKSDQPYSAN